LEVSAHTLSLVELQRAGVRLFLGDADVIEDIQNSPALNFKLSR
jgi:hypothetical protein